MSAQETAAGLATGPIQGGGYPVCEWKSKGWEAQRLGKQTSLERGSWESYAGNDFTEPRSRLAAWGAALVHRHVWSGSQSVLRKGKPGIDI